MRKGIYLYLNDFKTSVNKLDGAVCNIIMEIKLWPAEARWQANSIQPKVRKYGWQASLALYTGDINDWPHLVPEGLWLRRSSCSNWQYLYVDMQKCRGESEKGLNVYK